MSKLTGEQQGDLFTLIRRVRDDLLDLEQAVLDVVGVNDILNDAETAQENMNAIVQKLEDING